MLVLAITSMSTLQPNSIGWIPSDAYRCYLAQLLLPEILVEIYICLASY